MEAKPSDANCGLLEIEKPALDVGEENAPRRNAKDQDRSTRVLGVTDPDTVRENSDLNALGLRSTPAGLEPSWFLRLGRIMHPRPPLWVSTFIPPR